MVAFRGQMLTVRLMRQSAECVIWQHDHRNTPGTQPTLDFRGAIRTAFAPVVSAGLQDDGTGSVRHGAVQTSQHALGRIAVDAGVDHTAVESLCPQYVFELCWEGLIAGYSLAKSIAGAERHDSCRVRRSNRETRY